MPEKKKSQGPEIEIGDDKSGEFLDLLQSLNDNVLALGEHLSDLTDAIDDASQALVSQDETPLSGFLNQVGQVLANRSRKERK